MKKGYEFIDTGYIRPFNDDISTNKELIIMAFTTQQQTNKHRTKAEKNTLIIGNKQKIYMNSTKNTTLNETPTSM